MLDTKTLYNKISLSATSTNFFSFVADYRVTSEINTVESSLIDKLRVFIPIFMYLCLFVWWLVIDPLINWMLRNKVYSAKTVFEKFKKDWFFHFILIVHNLTLKWIEINISKWSGVSIEHGWHFILARSRIILFKLLIHVLFNKSTCFWNKSVSTCVFSFWQRRFVLHSWKNTKSILVVFKVWKFSLMLTIKRFIGSGRNFSRNPMSFNILFLRRVDGALPWQVYISILNVIKSFTITTGLISILILRVSLISIDNFILNFNAPNLLFIFIPHKILELKDFIGLMSIELG